jgi:tRNA nucleotidyltransferase (CCA-adding enzyme)
MRDSIRHVLQTLMNAGYEAYIVGGYVRDALLGIKTGDGDIATNATPDAVEALFEKVVTIGKVHGTITVIVGHEPIEVTTYRVDGVYGNHRHPQQVTYSSSLAEDLARRDFTINAMAMALDGTVTDLFGGQTDLKQKILRAIGDPNVRLQEDALRILRAIRFQSVLGMEIDPTLLNAMQAHATLVAYLSKERVLGELRKMLRGDYLSLAVSTYQKLSLPDLPSTFVVDNRLGLVEQFAIARLTEDFDASPFPWTKEEKALLQHLLSMAPVHPSDLALFDMHDAIAMIRVGALLYEWPLEACLQRYESLPIHHRRDLAINGHDVMNLGFSGPEVDHVLRSVEVAVLSHEVLNEHSAILTWLKENNK